MSNLLTTISPEFEILTQTNFLNRQVRDAVQPEYIWRRIASSEMEVYPSKIGIPEIISVRGLKTPKTQTNNVSVPTDLNAGMTARGANYEQFTIQVDRYDDLDYVDMFARNLPIADKFLETYITMGQGASLSQDFIARNYLYDAYTAGTTFVKTALSNASTTIHVDDVRRFQPYTGAQGEVATANVTVGANTYVLASVAYDGTNVSSLVFTDGSSFDGSGIFGRSGTLTFTTSVATTDATLNSPVVAVNAPTQIFANAATSLATLQSTSTLTMKDIQKARNVLANNGMLRASNGKAKLYATPNALYGLYRDPEFQLLYRGRYESSTYESGKVADLLNIEIIEVQSAPVQTNYGSFTVERSIMVADGAIIEARKTEDMVRPEVDGPAHVVVEDNIAVITTAPIDAANQFVKIAALQFVGYAARTDRAVTPAIIPTATVANYKRAVVLVSA